MRWNNIGSWTASGLKKESVSVSSLKESSKVHIGEKETKQVYGFKLLVVGVWTFVRSNGTSDDWHPLQWTNLNVILSIEGVIIHPATMVMGDYP